MTEDPEVSANRKQQEKILQEIQKEENPQKLNCLVGTLLDLVDERQAMLTRGKPSVENSPFWRKTGT